MARSLALLLVLALLAPGAAATWYASGSFEPDTPLDDPTYMWPDPPAGEGNPVYFNAHESVGYAGLNPNVGLARSRFESPAIAYVTAILGVWRDCNGDGHVGLAETAAREYRSALLLDDSRCPERTGPSTSWPAGAHNYNGWVSELIPIGRYSSPNDARVYVDPDARIWGDHGLPDGSATRVACAVTALPPGAAHRTGAFLDHMDCYTGGISGITSSQTYASLMDATTLGPQLGLGLRDPSTWDQAGHPLNAETFGDPSVDRTLVTTTDCDPDDRIYLTDDSPPGVDIDRAYVYAPSAPDDPLDAIHTDGSIAGTVTYLATSLHTPRTDPFRNGQCEWGQQEPPFYGLVEGDTADTDGGVKRTPDWNLEFYPGVRGRAPLGGLPLVGTPAAFGPGRAAGPSDLGVSALDFRCVQGPCGSSVWASRESYERGGPAVVRVDLAEQRAAIASGQYQTFYARVGPATTDRDRALPGGWGVYGAAACGEHEEGIRSGWDCDVTQWRATDRHGLPRPAPGTSYQLRDIDCTDDSFAPYPGLHVGIVPYGDQPC